jgi:hypothetical protein
MAAPTYQSSTTYASDGGSTTCTLNVPGSTANGDLLVAVVSSFSNRVITKPGGWSDLLSVSNSTVFLQQQWYYRVASSEPASYDWTLDLSRDFIGMMIRVTGQYSSPIDVASGQANTSNSTTAAHAGVTTGSANCLLLRSMAGTQNWNTEGPLDETPPGGMTEQQDFGTLSSPVSSHIYLHLDTETLASAGATGARDSTMSDSNKSLVGMVAIASQAAGGGGGSTVPVFMNQYRQRWG